MRLVGRRGELCRWALPEILGDGKKAGAFGIREEANDAGAVPGNSLIPAHVDVEMQKAAKPGRLSYSTAKIIPQC